MSGDFILHHDEQHFDDEGHDQLPSIRKEIESFNENHHPLILEAIPNHANFPLVFEVNILDLPMVSHVVPNDEGHLVFTKIIIQCEDIISIPSSTLVLNVHNVDNCIIDPNA